MNLENVNENILKVDNDVLSKYGNSKRKELLMKLARDTFIRLALRMIGFGIIIGFLFPPLMLLFGVSKLIAFSGLFISVSIFAGIIVGFVNILITSTTIKRKLRMGIQHNFGQTVKQHMIDGLDSSTLAIA